MRDYVISKGTFDDQINSKGRSTSLMFKNKNTLLIKFANFKKNCRFAKG